MTAVTRTESDLRQLAERGAAELADAGPEELLRWTDENFRDNYIVASNMQDGVLVEMAAGGLESDHEFAVRIHVDRQDPHA